MNDNLEEKPYPLVVLPPKILEAVQELIDYNQAPVSLVASSALGAMALAIQPHVDVARDNILSGPCCLFFMTIAESGERKTACDKHFTKSIYDYEKEQEMKMKPVLDDYQAEYDAFEMEYRGIGEAIKKLCKEKDKDDKIALMKEKLKELSASKPERPKIFRSIYNDVTVEALKSNLANNWPCAGLMSNEGGSILGSHAMGKDSITRTLSTFNILWDGGEIRTDRRTTENSIVRNARLSMLLLIQEIPLKNFSESSGGLARGIGTFSRFLISWPKSTQGTRLYKDPPADWPKRNTFNARIREILEKPVHFDDTGGVATKKLGFSEDAKKRWICEHNKIERELGSSGKYFCVKDVASKAAENASRLAVLFHVFENGFGGSIEPINVERAFMIISWHLNEAKRFFNRLSLSLEDMNIEKLNNWLVDYCSQRESTIANKRDVQRNITPVAFREKEKLDAALDKLAKLQRVRVVQEGKKINIHINPKLLTKNIR